MEEKGMIIKVVLSAFAQTSYEDYTHMFKTVEIQIPDDGKEWHVCGEQEAHDEAQNGKSK